MSRLVEGIDYYINENGLMVLTEKFLRERGYCCTNGCRHCPYGYKVPKRVNPGETGPDSAEESKDREGI